MAGVVEDVRDDKISSQSKRGYIGDTLARLRFWALVSGCVFYLVFMLMDLLRFPASLYSITVPIRVVMVMMPLFMATRLHMRGIDPQDRHFMGLLTLIFLNAGLVHSMLVYLTAQYGIDMPKTGLVLIIMYGCLLFGLPNRYSIPALGLILISVNIAYYRIGMSPEAMLLAMVIFVICSVLCLVINKVCMMILSDNFRLIQKLHSGSITDGLTGVHNRHYFDDQLLRIARRSARSGQQVSMVLVDVDHFKVFNDNHGHFVSDQILIRLAQLLDSFTRRPGDFTARLGGDEFVMVFEGLGLAHAHQVCSEVVTAVNAIKIDLNDVSIIQPITVSVGAVHAFSLDRKSVSAFMELADEALYSAKRGGRDRYCLSTLTGELKIVVDQN